MPASEFIERISDKWYRLIGSSAAFSLESRIFHSISIGLVILMAVYTPYNFFEGLYVALVSALLIGVFFYFQYYYSRFRGKAHSHTMFALIGLVIFSVNYFSNSGINGSTDVIWPAYLLLVLAISPYRQHILWVVVYIAAFFVLHYVAYCYPALVKHPFGPGRGEFIDRVTAFPIPVIGIAIIIIFIKKSYDKERAIAEEKTATIELQRNQLEQNNAEKSKLLSIISHDMRAPFTNIQSYLHLLNVSRLDDEERLMVEGELLQATDQTMEMLSNLLYWSKSQMDGAAINLAEAGLLAVLGKTIEVQKTLAVKKQITLSCNIDADITVVADANMLQLVIRNIINNAIKFTPQGGTIAIAAQLQADMCRISVTDNGTGIDENKKHSLFSMTSGPTFGTDNEKGVGLGLPLCKEFMERQGGHISLESTRGKGSTFFVFIPLWSRG